MKIGVDASCWVHKRGHGRYTRELLSTLLKLDECNHYRLFLDSKAAHECADLPDSERIQWVLVATSRAAVEGVLMLGRRSLRDLWAMEQAVHRYGQDLDLFYFPSATTFFPLKLRAKIVVTIHDAIPYHHADLIFPHWRSQLL